MSLIGTSLLGTIIMNSGMKRSFYLMTTVAILISVNQAFAQIGPSYDPEHEPVVECQMLGLGLSPNECNDTTILMRSIALTALSAIAIVGISYVIRKNRRHRTIDDFEVPSVLPADLTRLQFMILQSSHKGISKPKDIEKITSLDRNEIEKEIVVLKKNGFLTEKGKLTSKGLDMVSRG